MSNKSPAAQDQCEIATFITWLEHCIDVDNFEFGKADDVPETFVRHDGYTYSMVQGEKVITLKLSVKGHQEQKGE